MLTRIYKVEHKWKVSRQYDAESTSNTMWHAVICGDLRWSAVFRPTGTSVGFVVNMTSRSPMCNCEALFRPWESAWSFNERGRIDVRNGVVWRRLSFERRAPPPSSCQRANHFRSFGGHVTWRVVPEIGRRRSVSTRARARLECAVGPSSALVAARSWH